MDFGLMFFSSMAPGSANEAYRLLLDAAGFADAQGFSSIWTPERHFHEFGGPFPNPSVTSAALAVATDDLQIRAGSLISPLHDPIRIAEEWSMVDNLSGGRVAISFGSGWNIDDFVFYPENYERRREMMFEQIDTVQRLWRGETIMRTNSAGKAVDLRIYPQPIQAELPIWVTSSGNVDTFVEAGTRGANVLTHLIGQDVASLAEKTRSYREALRENHFDPAQCKVSLMLHTFLGGDREEVKATVHGPFKAYIRSAVKLEQMAAEAGGVISGGHKIEPHDVSERMMDELLELTFERYFHTAALMGRPEDCEELLAALQEAGVDDIACLIDFIDDRQAVMESLEHLNDLRRSFSAETARAAAESQINAFLADMEA